MNITKNIKIIDLALYLTKYKTLIISDTHLGYEESLNKQGVMIPHFHFKDLIQRLEPILKKIKPETIIINGDVKHEHGTISNQEWRHAVRLIDFLGRYCKKIILIKGNHDKVLGPIAEKKKITTADQLVIGNILITHGHKLIKELKGIKTIIIGHEHPAISFEQRPGENFKCFLKGTYKRKTLIVMPSLNLVTQGSDVTKEKLLSPFLKDISNFEAFVVGDKIYNFGKLKNL
ncbi:MAG: metallophosphoesterase [Candidatus Woesearchaeota archaeon]